MYTHIYIDMYVVHIHIIIDSDIVNLKNLIDQEYNVKLKNDDTFY